MSAYSLTHKLTHKSIISLTATVALAGMLSACNSTGTSSAATGALETANAMGINTTGAVTGAVTGALSGGASAAEIAKSAALGAINGGLTPATNTTNGATNATTNGTNTNSTSNTNTAAP